MDTPELEARKATTRRDTQDGLPERADGGPELAATLGNQGVGKVLSSPGVARSGKGQAQLDESVARAIQERQGRGQHLDAPVRREMESAFGQDLSDVRVHTDTTAHELNEAVSARAFTSGSDVFFKQGTYDPGSSSGRALLGHELTHVVQQRSGASGLAPGQVSHPADPAEREADAIGEQVADAAPTAEPAAVARQEEEEEMLQPSLEPDAVARQPEEEEELDRSVDPAAVAREAEEIEEEPV